MKLKWSPLAWHHLQCIYRYLTLDNPTAAKKVILTLENAAHNLTLFSELGKKGPIPGTRELVVSRLPYLLVYYCKDETISISAVLHTSRKWPKYL